MTDHFFSFIDKKINNSSNIAFNRQSLNYVLYMDFFHCFLPLFLEDKCYYYPHFAGKETKGQR